MEWVTVSARTVETAVEQALDMLGVHDTELEYEVVVEPKKGVLGIGRTDATIRARIKPVSREKPNDRRRRRGRDERKPKGEGGKPKAEQAPKQQGGPKSEAKSGPKPAPKPQVEGAATADGDAAPTEGGGNRSRNRRRGGRGGGQGAAASSEATAETTAAPATGETETPTPAERKPRPQREAPVMTGSITEQLDAARTFAEGFLDAFGVEGSVAVESIDDEAIEVSITGQDLGLLLGPQGATLSAIEELLRGSVGHRGPARLHLDIAGYRARRKAALADFARKVAADVLASGAAKALEPMGSADRKVVHDTVAEIDGVTTMSDGEDARRRVVIKPA